jgi:hypothetical protein
VTVVEWVAVEPLPAGLTHIAPAGTIYVCQMCGKTAKDSYDGPGGWDVSCMLNAVLCYQSASAGDGNG